MTVKPPALKLERMPPLFMAIAALLAGLWAALLRLGWILPGGGANLSADHGPLMVSGFFGTLITLERAVAIGSVWAYSAPVLTGAGAVLLLAGVPGMPGPLLITFGSFALMLNFVPTLRPHNELFTVTMALGAVEWAVGNGLWMAGWPIPEIVSWWMAFLVLTIMGERMELSRLYGQSRAARPVFAIAMLLFVCGPALAMDRPQAGFAIFGAGMTAFGAWIGLFDVARKTVRSGGLPGFAAVNLMLGAFWLALSGAMRIGFPVALDFFQYDAVLHAVFLGFVFSMIFAHAPVIFPTIIERPLPFRRLYYIHVAALQLSLALRIADDLAASAPAWHWGATLNVVAIVMFLVDTAYGIVFATEPGIAPIDSVSLVQPKPHNTTVSR